MKITTITVFFLAMSCLAIWSTFQRINRESIGIRSGLVWIAMWGCIGFFSIFPELLDTAMHLAQMENRMFFILVIAAFVLFGMVFNLSTRIDKVQRDMAKLVQGISIINYKIGNTENTQTSDVEELEGISIKDI